MTSQDQTEDPQAEPYANGGLITGPYTRQSDTIPAWLSPGCTYITPKPGHDTELLRKLNEDHP